MFLFYEPSLPERSKLMNFLHKTKLIFWGGGLSRCNEFRVEFWRYSAFSIITVQREQVQNSQQYASKLFIFNPESMECQNFYVQINQLPTNVSWMSAAQNITLSNGRTILRY